jgi:asparagine synthase (glutamine-hydrolysing)
VPYCDTRLVQYCYDLPQDLLSQGRREKGLLRAAVADLLPEKVLNRPKSAYPATQDHAYGELLRARFAELRNDPGAPVAPLLDEDATADALRGAPGDPQGLSWVQRAGFEMALQLNTWLTEYQVQLAL